MKITGSKVTIRPIEEKDIQDIYNNAKDKEIARFTRVPHPYKVKDAKAYVNDSQKKWKDNTDYSFAIIEKKHQKLVGTISLKDVSLEKKTAEIGYWIGKEYWKRGYANDALLTIEQFAKEKGIKKIYAYVMPENNVSLHLLQKNSYIKQRTILQNEQCNNEETVVLTKHLSHTN